MRFELLKAQDFGPFCGQELALAPGMTLVYGPNESGKSTWHAAIYAGLCGVRRGRGRQSEEDREFRERHKPWNSTRWRVVAIIELEDGRRIELRQDLDGRVDCRATDLVLGRDCSSEIMFEGSPDGSRWLGLDRRSFLATACVRQTELLQVKDDAFGLQNYLQRAADTAGVDQTAAAALQRIDTFRTENVGQDRQNSNRPLPSALRAVQIAHKGLEVARQEHSGYLKMIADADRLQQHADRAQTRLRLFRSAITRRSAEVEAARLRRAQQLAGLFPSGQPPPLAQDDVLAQQVKAAVEGWEHRPAMIVLDGETLGDLRLRIDGLPQMPVGEIMPDPYVLKARERVAEADALLADHATNLPVSIEAGGDGSPYSPAHKPTQDVAEANQSWWPPLLLGGFVVLVGLAFVAAGMLFVGVASIVIGLLAWSILRTRALRRAKGAPTAARPANALGLERSAESWQQRATALDRARVAALRNLAAALQSRGVLVDGQDRSALEGSCDAYIRACEARRIVASVAARRPDLEARARDRQQAEMSAAESTEQIRQAREGLLIMGDQCEVDGKDETELALELGRWLESRHIRLADDEERSTQWIELQTLLSDQTLAELEEQIQRLFREADRHSEGVGGSVELEDDVESQRSTLEREARDAKQVADQAIGMAQERRKLVHAVAEAEESLARAEADLVSLRRLDDILERTREFLARAQERVHRDIAPVLAEGLREWLPRVTEGRYTHAVVDPQTLDVQVSGGDGRLRYAHLLSHGTAEQVYLLLRAVMARHLTERGEVCPLVLDDVTVHCDSPRQVAVLHVLHELSMERQVILFTQEDAVLRWARAELVGSRDRIIQLAGPEAIGA